MSYLENLRKFVSENFNATDVKDVKAIENFTKLNGLIDEAESDYSKVVSANAELSKTLTEYAIHTSVPVAKNEPNVQNAPKEDKLYDINTDKDFDKALSQYLKENK